MKVVELKNMGIDDLKARQDELITESFNLRMQHRMGQLDNPNKIRFVRRDIARVKTIIVEKQKES